MPARKKRGFTLIELLVVIAIIAILAAILFPVFARAREAARKSTCQSNLKENAIALHTYWNDFDATLPSSFTSQTYHDYDGDPFVNFATKLGRVPVPTTGTVSAMTPQTWCQMLYNSHKGKDIFFCPSDSADHNDPNATVSYWWKYAADRAWNQLKRQKEADFGYNADQIILYERAGFHSGASAGLRNDVQINVVFLDTHVKSVSLTNSAPADGAFVTAAVADGEPWYYNFNNDLPKGTGNPPAATVRPQYYDPSVYSDMLP